MYEYLIRGADALGSDQRSEAVLHHQGSCLDFLKRHHEDAACAWREGLRGVRACARHLLARIADPRALRLSWDFLAARGGQAPGENGLRYRDLASAEVWDLCRCLGRAIKDGTYRPGPERVCWIAKGSGRGRRPIVVLNVEDRVVQRAVNLILQPVLDPLLGPRSLGFRPKLGHLHALALAESLALAQRRRVWLTQDIKDAFGHVSLTRLLQVVEKLLPASDLLDLLHRVLPGQKLPGLRQGGSLSPSMLNVYLHHFLDRPWQRDQSGPPLVRVADDLLVLCRNEHQARGAHEELERLLLPAGMPLKLTVDEAIHDLAAGESADWLGFTISKAPRGLAVEIAERAWERLGAYLALAHTKSDAPLRANHTIRQWFNQRGPCYAWSDRQQICQHIIDVAHRQGFEDCPGSRELQERWQRAHARWCRLRKSARDTVAAREGH